MRGLAMPSDRLLIKFERWAVAVSMWLLACAGTTNPKGSSTLCQDNGVQSIGDSWYCDEGSCPDFERFLAETGCRWKERGSESSRCACGEAPCAAMLCMETVSQALWYSKWSLDDGALLGVVMGDDVCPAQVFGDPIDDCFPWSADTPSGSSGN